MNRNPTLLGVVLSVLAVDRSNPVHCQAPEWSASLQGTYIETTPALSSGDNGCIYMTGKVSDGYFAGDPIDVNGAYDIYLVKFDAVGEVQWLVTAGGPESFASNDFDFGADVLYDSASNAVYLCGGYKGFTDDPAIFGPGIEVSGQGAFIAKYDTSGTCLWMNYTSGGAGTSVGVDDAGSVYLYCFSPGDVGTMSYNGMQDVLVANGPSLGKYSGNGQLLWAKSLGDHIDGGIEVHNDRIYFAGGTYLTGSVLLGESIPHNASIGVAILAALDTSATQILWRTTYLSTVLSNVVDVSFANDTTIILVGPYQDSLFLPADTLVGPMAEYRTFCAVVDTSGTTWNVSTLDANTSNAKVSAAPDGSIYQLLRFSGTLELPNATITSGGTGDMAIVRCQLDGTVIAAIQCGPVEETAMDVLATGDNGVAVCGRFLDSVALGGNVTYTGNNDAFIAKYDAITAVPFLQPITNEPLLIYANPNDGTCTIDLPETLEWNEDLVLKVYDIEGRLIHSAPIGRSLGTLPLDIRAHAKGSYPVEVSDGRQRYTGRIVFE